MKYVFFAIFFLICLGIFYFFFKRKEKKALEHFKRKEIIAVSRVELLKIQEQFIKADLTGSFKTCPNIRDYILNIIGVLNVYDDIENVKFYGRSIENQLELYREYEMLTEKKKRLFMQASMVSNRLCGAIDPRKCNEIIRKKKWELRKISFLLSICVFLENSVKFLGKLNDFISLPESNVSYNEREITDIKNDSEKNRKFLLEAY